LLAPEQEREVCDPSLMITLVHVAEADALVTYISMPHNPHISCVMLALLTTYILWLEH